MTTDRARCATCSAILPPDGRCIECVSTKPWMRKCWTDRRDQVVARTTTCEWCAVTFTQEEPPVVHHIKSSYKTAAGEIDWFAYMSMFDDEVVVICRPCHVTWEKRGKKRVPARPCVGCGALTSAPSGACSKKCAHEHRMRADPDYREEQILLRFWSRKDTILDDRPCTCSPMCDYAMYALVVDGETLASGAGPRECQIMELAQDFPGWLYWSNDGYEPALEEGPIVPLSPP